MFEESFVESRRSRFTKKPATVVLSIAVHSCVVGAVILIPLFQLQVLPQIHSDPPLPPFRMPRGEFRVMTVGGSAPSAHRAELPSARLIEPTTIPVTIALGSDIGPPDLES